MAKPTKVGDKWRVQFRRKGQPSVSRYFDKKSHADAFSRQIDHEIRAGEYNSTKEFTNTTVEDILVRYEAEVSKTKEMGRSKLHCLKTLRTHLGSTFINKLKSESVIDYANKRQTMGAGGVTINIELTYLKGALKIAKLLWKIPIKSDPVADARVALKHLGLITKSKKRDRRPTDAEISQLVEYYKNKVRQVLPMADIIQFAIASAMRAGEIGSLKWVDLNEGDKTILIRAQRPTRQNW